VASSPPNSSRNELPRSPDSFQNELRGSWLVPGRAAVASSSSTSFRNESQLLHTLGLVPERAAPVPGLVPERVARILTRSRTSCRRVFVLQLVPERVAASAHARTRPGTSCPGPRTRSRTSCADPDSLQDELPSRLCPPTRSGTSRSFCTRSDSSRNELPRSPDAFRNVPPVRSPDSFRNELQILHTLGLPPERVAPVPGPVPERVAPVLTRSRTSRPVPVPTRTRSGTSCRWSSPRTRSRTSAAGPASDLLQNELPLVQSPRLVPERVGASSRGRRYSARSDDRVSRGVGRGHLSPTRAAA
jgi:hypothetical protein